MQTRRVAVWLVLSLLLVTLGACDSFSGKVVARVNGEKITITELEQAVLKKLSSQLVKSVPKDAALRELKEEVLAEVINGKIIEQRARELHIEVDDKKVDKSLNEIKAGYEGAVGAKVLMEVKIDDKQWKRDFKKRLLYELVIEKDVYERITVNDTEARNFYNANPRRYPSETKVRLAQIVVDNEQKARSIAERLKGGEDFAQTAKKESIAPEGVRGGDLGYISRGVMPASIDRIAFALAAGKISNVIKSPYGYHILKVLDREEIRRGDFERMKARVIDDIKTNRGEEAFKVWLDGLKNKAKIEIDKAALGSFISANSSLAKEESK